MVSHFIYYDHSDIILQLHSSGGNSMRKAVITLWITCTTFYIIVVLLLIHSAFISYNRTNIQNEVGFPLICSRDILPSSESVVILIRSEIQKYVLHVLSSVIIIGISRTKCNARFRFNGRHFIKWRIRRSTNLRLNAKCFHF